jgi:hypothetical protein
MVPNFTLFVYSRNVKYTLCRLGTPGLKQRVQLAVAQVVREYLEGTSSRKRNLVNIYMKGHYNAKQVTVNT